VSSRAADLVRAGVSSHLSIPPLLLSKSGHGVRPIWSPTQAAVEDSLQESIEWHPCSLGRLGEVLTTGNLRVRVRLKDVDLPGLVEAQIHSSAATQFQASIDALGKIMDALRRPFTDLTIDGKSTSLRLGARRGA
jgi:hypothetical protein